MDSLGILKSFIDNNSRKAWCVVHYKFNGKRDTFWERSRKNNELKDDISCNVPTAEKEVYKRGLHAEKYAIERLQIKLNDLRKYGNIAPAGFSWWVNMYINKPPCDGHWPCVKKIKKFAEQNPNIKITVKYTGEEKDYNLDSIQNLWITPFNMFSWKFLIRRIIKLKKDQKTKDILLMARLRGILKDQDMEEKELRYVLKSIFDKHK